MSPKLRTLLILVAVIVPLDQFTKYLVVSNVEQGGYVAPIAALDGFFRITHSRNPGAALGLAQNVHVYFFVALTLVALALIGSFFRRIEAGDRLSAVSLGLIVSGAMGNLLDRIVRGEVIDFLQFNLGLFIFPDFNVADSAIVIGVALLLLDVVTQETESGVAAKGAPEERDG
ncbi:MAG TPA: signal peptidase II [Myxococcota bacterium]|nr:signal peptidase II [Myxococcota bacterium]